MGKMRKIEKSTAGPIVLPNRLNTITSPRSPEEYSPPQVVRSKATSFLSSSGLSILKTEASFQSGVNNPYNNLERPMPTYVPRDIQTRNQPDFDIIIDSGSFSRNIASGYSMEQYQQKPNKTFDTIEIKSPEIRKPSTLIYSGRDISTTSGGSNSALKMKKAYSME